MSDPEASEAPSPLAKKLVLSISATLFALLLVFLCGEIVLCLVPSLALTNAFESHLKDRPPHFYNYAYAPTYRTIPKEGEANEKTHRRIAVLGDSFTEGSGVHAQDRWSERLQIVLNLKQPKVPPVDVMNFAKSGTSTYQQLDQLDRALAAEPDLVVLGMCLNDVEDWRDPTELMRMIQQELPQKPTGLTALMVRRSRFARQLYLKKEHRRGGKLLLDYYEKIYDPDYAGWQLFVDAAEKMQARCTEAEVPFLVMIWPLLNGEMDPEHYAYHYCHQRLTQVWKALEVPVFDLSANFQGMDPLRLQCVPGVDPHPSEIAHRVAAESLWKYLVAQGYLPEEYHDKKFYRRDGTHKRWRIIADDLEGRSFFPDPKAAEAESKP